MYVKIIRLGAKREEHLYECRHVVKTNVPGSDAMTFEMVPGPTITLDREGDQVYMMNDEAGDTIDSWRFPVQRAAAQGGSR